MKYTKSKNTYFATPKDDDKDRIEIEIGDSKHKDVFHTQFKLMRWDNESNVSIRLVDDEIEDGKIIKEDNKIKLIKSKKECHFYEIEPCEEHPEGGFEFEIVLKEKPITNKIEFTLETKGLDFFYQPALNKEKLPPDGVIATETEIVDKNGRVICKRPENVVGSYAVYASENKTNYVGGKEYKSGKVGHIFRPKIIDAEGKEVWGELKIENGILSVTIPQEFLDKAVYPVRHAAGLTFGYEESGGSNTTLNTGGTDSRGSIFTSPADLSGFSKLTVYNLKPINNSYTETKSFICDEDGNLLTNGVSDIVDVVYNDLSWKDYSFSPVPTLTASTPYIFMVIGEYYQQVRLYYDTGDSNQGYRDANNDYSTPEDLSSPNLSTHKFSIYCTYIATTTGLCTTKGNIKNTLAENCVVKGRIGRTEGRVCTISGRIKVADVTKTATIRGRIEKTETQTTTCKARIEVVDIQSYITTKGNIRATIEQIATCKSRIQKAGTRNIICRADISTTYSQPITTKANIRHAYEGTCDTKGNILQTQGHLATTKGRIETLNTKICTTKARIEQARIKSCIALANILAGYGQEVTTKANIRAAITTLIYVNGNIRATQAMVVGCRGNIRTTAEQASSTKARIERGEVKSLTCLGRIEVANVGSLITVKGNIKGVKAQFVVARARVTRGVGPEVLCKGNIRATNVQICTTKGDIRHVYQQQTTCKGNVLNTQDKICESRGNIRSTIIRTCIMKGRIEISEEAGVVCKARIQTGREKLTTTLANIKAAVSRHVFCKAYISVAGTVQITCRGNIKNTLSQTCITSGRIRYTNEQTIACTGNIRTTQQETCSCIGNIKQGQSHALTTRGRIKIKGLSAHLTTKADIRETVAQNITVRALVLAGEQQSLITKGSIRVTTGRFVSVRARIGIIGEHTVFTTGRIRATEAQQTIVGADIRNTIEQTTTCLGRIGISVEPKTCTTKANIRGTQLVTTTCLGRVEVSMTQNVTAKANIITAITRTKTIQTHGNIVVYGYRQTVICKARIWESGEPEIVEIVDQQRGTWANNIKRPTVSGNAVTDTNTDGRRVNGIGVVARDVVPTNSFPEGVTQGCGRADSVVSNRGDGCSVGSIVVICKDINNPARAVVNISNIVDSSEIRQSVISVNEVGNLYDRKIRWLWCMGSIA